ncbi:CidA/LrgA family protein [Sapientia aquatica]|uniref:CidA/LrgA family protein n=1 Tax=Sapientia aquatica TaxID=1549640 RepID=A0A4R5W3J7_9BURK|nr:CidA/LrgA family protein [Sapientia aquatica]TDK67152.1 CidA/LrgA family protein [Sapientia aquatica]
MLITFAVLLIFQCIGEGASFLLQLPIPGPVVGMLLLFFALLLSTALLEQMEATATELLRHLSLLFVPAGVGIIVSASSVQGHWWGVVVAVVSSTVITLAATAAVMRIFIPNRATSVSSQGSTSKLDNES